MRCVNITGSGVSNTTAGSRLEHWLYKSLKCFSHLFFHLFFSSWPERRLPCLSLVTQTLDASFLVIFLTPSNATAKVTNVFFAWSLHLLAWYLADRWYASLSALRRSSGNRSVEKIVVHRLWMLASRLFSWLLQITFTNLLFVTSLASCLLDSLTFSGNLCAEEIVVLGSCSTVTLVSFQSLSVIQCLRTQPVSVVCKA